jgi:hypothetical protein
MKKNLLIMLLLPLTFSIKAQSTICQSEIGFITTDFDNYGITYKISTDSSSLWRFGVMNLTGSDVNYKEENAFSSSSKTSAFALSFRIGREHRRVLSKGLELRYGGDMSFTYSRGKQSGDDFSDIDGKTYIPGINLVAGLSYIINDKIVIGAELNPYLSYAIGQIEVDGSDETLNTYSLNYGIANIPVQFTLAYIIK